MPRQPRLDAPGIPQHIVQRGNDRQACFFEPIDRIRYLDELHELSIKLECAIHAYVLMTNHVHLLITSKQHGQISRLMQSLGRRYVRYINDRYQRTGTLWEGRFKSCLVESDTYLLRCQRYIELNPVRAGMAGQPQEYPWSSFRSNALGCEHRMLQPHPAYLALGDDPDARRRRYCDLFEYAPDPHELDTIRRNLQRQHALGTPRFRSAIESQLARRAGPAKIGRPRKSSPA